MAARRASGVGELGVMRAAKGVVRGGNGGGRGEMGGLESRAGGGSVMSTSRMVTSTGCDVAEVSGGFDGRSKTTSRDPLLRSDALSVIGRSGIGVVWTMTGGAGGEAVAPKGPDGGGNERRSGERSEGGSATCAVRDTPSGH